ncbi:MAG: heparinase II/III family protein [Bacteroidota bacterium]
MTARTALKYYHTVKYLQPVQTFGRLYAVLKEKLPIAKIPDTPPGNLQSRPLKILTDFIDHDTGNSRENILSGTFTFLNRCAVLGYPGVNWSYSDAGLLWSYNLHYFNYLFRLTEQEKISLCAGWTEQNKNTDTTGWQAYPLSLRIVNWCKCGFSDERILRSLYRQTAYLYRHLEFYHPANHYLENAKALIFAGLLFDGTGESGEWLKKGVEIIDTENRRQIHEDGAYFELTPMYHSIILNGYLDLLNIIPAVGDSRLAAFRKSLTAAAEKMTDYLYSVTHPDGTLPLFNDSTHEIAPPPRQLITYAEKILNYKPVLKNEFSNAGHYVMRHGEIFLIIDGGQLGPDNIPAHAHADIFNYELSAGGEKFIVDSGVYEYIPGEMRSYCRSTSAHNTLTIDGCDQAECWGGFRVARRYKPESVSFIESADGIKRFSGKFTGYSKLIGDSLVHTRTVELNERSREIRITDIVEGSRSHLAESRLHLHPSVSIAASGDGIKISRGISSLKIIPLSGQLKTETGWYCPEFGVRLQNKVINIYAEKNPPISISYLIRY